MNPSQEQLKLHKPEVYKKVIRFPEKLAKGESIAIIQFQYNFLCNFQCEHCSIEKFFIPPKKEAVLGKKFFTLDDVRELAQQAHDMGLAHFVITGGEPLIFRDLDQLAEAIGPDRFYLVSDTNGWRLDDAMAKHMKQIGFDKVQLSIDGADPKSHDEFRRRPGSWERVVKAIDACKNNDLHLILSTVVWKDRVYTQEWLDFLEFVKSKDVGCYVTFAKPVGAYEGRLDQMMTEKEAAMIEEWEKEHNIFTHMSPSYGRDIGCIAVKRMVSVTRYGDVLPCPYTHVSLGNFFEEPLKDIINRGLNITWFDPKKKMPCICGVDKTFIKDVVSKTYGEVEVPVPYHDVFTSDDFLDETNMGKVLPNSGTGKVNTTHKSASPTIVRGKTIE